MASRILAAFVLVFAWVASVGARADDNGLTWESWNPELFTRAQAEQRLVKTGLRQSGQVEVIEGLAAGELVATDGAAFLTDKAKVKLAESESTKTGQAQ